MMIAAGLGIFAFRALQLPRWATERERQMDALAELASGFAATSRQKKLPRSSEEELPVLDELPDATSEEEETSVPSRNRDRI
jgi:hypothetical protein